MGMKSAIKQETGLGKGSYIGDGQQAYYLLTVDGEDTWFTSATSAINAWESAGGELYVGRSTRDMKKIR